MSTYIYIDPDVYSVRYEDEIHHFKGCKANIECWSDSTKQEILSELVRRVKQFSFKFQWELDNNLEAGCTAMTKILLCRAKEAANPAHTVLQKLQRYSKLLNVMWHHQKTREVNYER